MASVSVARLQDAACWRVVFGESAGNILTGELMRELSRVFHDARDTPELKAVVFAGAGTNFSFGASIQEHLPDRVADMLRAFHELILAIVDSPVVAIAAVNGRCLGGGLELACAAQRIIASASAEFGQPEISLGVFAPAASVLLPRRIGPARAADLCLTGRSVNAIEAREMALIDEVVDTDPIEAAEAWVRSHLGARSASSIRHAVRALRLEDSRVVRDQLPVIERLYLDELMKTPDAIEGLKAFLEKRAPRWKT